MSDIKLGGFAIQRGRITLPRRGNWESRWAYADSDFPVGVFAGSILGEQITGYAKRTGAPFLEAQIQAVGGMGNITPTKVVDCRDYRYASFAQIVRELIQDAGEQVAEDVLVGIDQQLKGWTRFQGPWIAELERLIATRNDPNDINDGTTWKVRLADGQIEIRPLVEQDTTPDLTILADKVTERKRIYALDDEESGLVIKPGDRFDGIIVDTVEYQFETDATRVEVFYHLAGETADPAKEPRLDRMAALWQDLIDLGIARYRDSNVDPLGYYFGTVRDVRGNGDVDIEADDLRIGFVNDVPVFSGLPGWQIKPVAKSLTSPGARVLFGWQGGDKSKKCCIAWAAEPAASLDTATIEATTLVEYKVPTHRVIGNSEVTEGDDRTEHDVGIGPELTIADAAVGAATGLGSAIILGMDGTDSAFTVRVQADTAANPPVIGGVAVTVTPRRSFGKVPRSVQVTGADDGTTAAVFPGGYGSADEIKITVGKGLTKSAIYRFSVQVKV
jgi:hypothetical protein